MTENETLANLLRAEAVRYPEAADAIEDVIQSESSLARLAQILRAVNKLTVGDMRSSPRVKAVWDAFKS